MSNVWYETDQWSQQLNTRLRLETKRRREEAMAVQLTRMLDAGMRKELRERMKALLDSYGAAEASRDKGEDEFAAATKRIVEEVKAFYFSLTGSQPTNDELKEMLG